MLSKSITNKTILNLIFYTGFFIVIAFSGCVATAKLKDFPSSSSAIDFDKYSKELATTKSPFWTLKSSNEYYFEKSLNISEDTLIELIVRSLEEKGFRIEIIDKKNKKIIGKRGMRANEWNSITGVYYNITESKVQVYINTKITQDITGGWRENRAKKIGNLIENSL